MARTKPRNAPARVAHARNRRRSGGGLKSTVAIVVAALLVVVVSATSLTAVAAWDLVTSAQKSIKLVGQDEIPQIGEIEGGVNLLLVGSDSREGQDPIFGENEGGVLNDVNMLMHISADHTSATVVSIPRDLVVPIADCPDGGGGWTGPINASLNDGGLPCVVLTVEELTGLQIQYAALVQFGGVIGLADAIGGVDVCVAETINDDYTQLYLPAGMNTVSGFTALQFLRTRHGVGDGSDLGRISNQQVFLSALVRKLKAEGTLNNPVTLYNLAKAALNNMQLSDSLANVDTMVSIAMALRNIPLDRVVFVQYPGATGGTGVYSGKVQPKVAAAAELFDAIQNDQPIALSGSTGRGSVEGAAPADGGAPVVVTPMTSKSNGIVSLLPSTTKPTPRPSAPPTELAPPVVITDQVEGQNAGQYTCSKGNN